LAEPNIVDLLFAAGVIAVVWRRRYPWQPMLADQIIADSGAVAGVIAIVGAGVGAC
jgi:hypothetical protein